MSLFASIAAIVPYCCLPIEKVPADSYMCRQQLECSTKFVDLDLKSYLFSELSFTQNATLSICNNKTNCKRKSNFRKGSDENAIGNNIFTELYYLTHFKLKVL